MQEGAGRGVQLEHARNIPRTSVCAAYMNYICYFTRKKKQFLGILIIPANFMNKTGQSKTVKTNER